MEWFLYDRDLRHERVNNVEKLTSQFKNFIGNAKNFQNNYDHLIFEPKTSISSQNNVNIKNYLNKYKTKVGKNDYKAWKKGTILIAGDSVLCGVREYKMPKHKSIKIRAFSGATIQDIYLFLVPHLKKSSKKSSPY